MDRLEAISGGISVCPSSPAPIPRTPDLVESSRPHSSMSGGESQPPAGQGQVQGQVVRQNQVSTVMLHGIPIVCLFIDSRERLCLAQISNTLLKDFSYNEIHNRRVALGITCVQCTPVQLEILRRAGAMPISSRRCGMITKREAERLVKSFLEDISPPKLPENFAFNVVHECGWGCKGAFVPSRYNSSRAKCIKCTLCNLFFSPNKFIFHFHRSPESKYRHPDAANFNSWRRHLRLDYDNTNEDMVHAWEDVKAMFNGGSRKRLVNPSGKSPSHHSRDDDHHHINKKPRMDMEPPVAAISKMAGISYPYPVMAMPNNPCTSLAGYLPRPAAPHPAFPFVPTEHAPFPDRPKAPNFTDFWKNKASPVCHPFNFLWAKNFGLYPDATPYRNVMDLSQPPHKSLSPDGLARTQEMIMDRGVKVAVPEEQRWESDESRDEDDKYFSAFKPVSRENTSEHKHSKGLSPRDVEYPEDKMDKMWAVREQSETSEVSALDETDSVVDNDDTDINVTDVDHNDVTGTVSPPVGETIDVSSVEPVCLVRKNDTPVVESRETVNAKSPSPVDPVNAVSENNNDIKSQVVEETPERSTSQVSQGGSPTPCSTDPSSIYTMSKEELQKELQRLLSERKTAEQEYHSIKDNLEHKSHQEVKYREDLSQQMHVVRESLCHEIDQEKQAREQMQQKLREAHEALSQFSGKMMALKNCLN